MRLAGELGVSRTTAEVLIRRGCGTAAEASELLEQDGPAHDPLLLGDMGAACDRIERAIAGSERICVHGDYDADGICATALAVTVLQELGADVVWHLPSRFEEGYGVGSQALERLAGDGVSLVLTVDCGVTAVDEVRKARGLGLDVIVSDHHRPGEELPECPLVCTRPSDYPFPELCGTGVVYKLAEALWRRAGRDQAALDRNLDLVALATVADVVPLKDENRRLVRAGLRRLARTDRPGLRALMRAARIDRARVRAADLGFRLAPRINAAGRLGHPGAALELLLTADDERASELAEQLETLNRRRQSVEEEILDDAVSMVEAREDEWRERRAYVLASPDWHEGVIGIVASRLVERFKRPVVLIAIGHEQAKGSGRSIPAYDLHGGLASAGDCLLRFGGHRAAAGLTIEPSRIPELAERLAAHAADALQDGDLNPAVRVDAVVAPAELSLELADELARLEPFGLGNPDVTLLCPAAAVHGVEAMGEGRHLRMSVELGGFRCRAVGFGLGATLAEMQQARRVDVAFRLHRNEWNGTVTPQMVLRAVQPLGDAAPLPGVPAEPAQSSGSGYRDAREGGLQVATVARLLAGGSDCAVVVADRPRREQAIARALRPDRFGAASLALLEYGDPLAERFGELVVLDPPADAQQAAWLEACSGRSTVHLVWGQSEVTFVRDLAHQREPVRDTLAGVWRALRAGAAPEVPDQTLEQCLRVLDELGLDPRADSPGRVDLEGSPTYCGAVERAAAVDRFLEGIASPAAEADDRPALVPAAG